MSDSQPKTANPVTGSSADAPVATGAVSFSQAAEEEQPGLIREFFEFLGESKKWWLLPIIIVLLLVGLIVMLSSSVVAPFIYPFV